MGGILEKCDPDRRPGDYQHAACRILNGIAKRTETTLQALPLGTPQNGGTFFSFPPSKRSIGMGLTRGGSKIVFGAGSLVRPSMSLRHMHHCMSMNALDQGLLGLEAAKASDIDDFV